MEQQVGVGSRVGQSLNGVTATTVGDPFAFTFARKVIGMQTLATGGATISCVLQGSLDGTNWFTLATSTSATGDFQVAVDKPVMFARANLTLSNGTAPTFSAWICAV